MGRRVFSFFEFFVDFRKEFQDRSALHGIANLS